MNYKKEKKVADAIKYLRSVGINTETELELVGIWFPYPTYINPGKIGCNYYDYWLKEYMLIKTECYNRKVPELIDNLSINEYISDIKKEDAR